MQISPPVIILVRPQMGENIGAAARAMMNFGLSTLRLVAPRDGWPNEKAASMAARATPIVHNATVHDTLEDACADLTYLYATTARKRDLTLTGSPPDRAMLAMQHHPTHRYGVLFGPENNGLNNDDLTLCNQLIHIPTSAKNPSLNLGQAVMITAYEWMRASMSAATTPAPDNAPAFATKHDVTTISQHWAVAGYPANVAAQERLQKRLQQLLTTIPLHKADIDFLHGAIKAITP